jgi:hypothetical protein
VGDFDYVSMREALYSNMFYVAPIYFGLFCFLFIFILVNLFTVIVVGTYQHVQHEKREEDKQILLQQGSQPKGLQYLVYLVRVFRRWWSKTKFNWVNWRSDADGEASLLERLQDPKLLASGYISEDQLKSYIADDMPEESLEELMVIHRQKLPNDEELKKILKRKVTEHEMMCMERAKEFDSLTPPEMMKHLHVPTFEMLKLQKQSFDKIDRKVQRLYMGSRSNLQVILQTEKKIERLKQTLWR